jgi:hypothetical protein
VKLDHQIVSTLIKRITDMKGDSDIAVLEDHYADESLDEVSSTRLT